MKCGAWVLWKMMGKKKPKRKVSITISMFNHYVRDFPLTDKPYKGHESRYKEEDLEKCEGDVVATVAVGIEGGCGCCGSAELRIEYKCKKCGNTDFAELPSDDESLSKFLTGFVSSMGEVERFDRLNRKKEEQKAYDAQIQKMMRENEERREKRKKQLKKTKKGKKTTKSKKAKK